MGSALASVRFLDPTGIYCCALSWLSGPVVLPVSLTLSFVTQSGLPYSSASGILLSRPWFQLSAPAFVTPARSRAALSTAPSRRRSLWACMSAPSRTPSGRLV
ncbi:hypothetical protein BU14_0836s0001 [Porphyra umbilicalis]|uniref:Uncharacterized protein n=1 Tax=Porphyra umbilicalis TaxID=2786 RepID=A0A1X6NP15_PORUM|nr:hypothetical protein BU14_0836s0001 [Porphyra umbilicalis]|eukprot:OSX70236.1 hypothetical protein BU14_0836s0001 [Porphyra umbilicalis]